MEGGCGGGRGGAEIVGACVSILEEGKLRQKDCDHVSAPGVLPAPLLDHGEGLDMCIHYWPGSIPGKRNSLES